MPFQLQRFYDRRHHVPGTLGERIFALRSMREMLQGDLARHIGISQNALCQIEKDKVDPRVSHVVAIANALGTTPNVLLGWEDMPSLQDWFPRAMHEFIEWRDTLASNAQD